MGCLPAVGTCCGPQVLRQFVTTEAEAERLDYFASAEGRDDLYAYNQKEGAVLLPLPPLHFRVQAMPAGRTAAPGATVAGQMIGCPAPPPAQLQLTLLYATPPWVPTLALAGRTVVEVLSDFKSARPPLEWLLQSAPRLKPRLFSIASSPRLHPTTAQLTVALVDWATPNRRRRRGVCTSWLAGGWAGEQGGGEVGRRGGSVGRGGAAVLASLPPALTPAALLL